MVAGSVGWPSPPPARECRRHAAGRQAATIASTGQTALQAESPPVAAHSSHSAGSITKVLSAELIAPFGHSGSHAAQAMHSLSRIVFATEESSCWFGPGSGRHGFGRSGAGGGRGGRWRRFGFGLVPLLVARPATVRADLGAGVDRPPVGRQAEAVLVAGVHAHAAGDAAELLDREQPLVAVAGERDGRAAPDAQAAQH